MPRKSTKGIRILTNGKMVREFKVKLEIQTTNLDMTVCDLFEIIRTHIGSTPPAPEETVHVIDCSIDYMPRRKQA